MEPISHAPSGRTQNIKRNNVPSLQTMAANKFVAKDTSGDIVSSLNNYNKKHGTNYSLDDIPQKVHSKISTLLLEKQKEQEKIVEDVRFLFHEETDFERMQRMINENPINPAEIQRSDNEAYRMMHERGRNFFERYVV